MRAAAAALVLVPVLADYQDYLKKEMGPAMVEGWTEPTDEEIDRGNALACSFCCSLSQAIRAVQMRVLGQLKKKAKVDKKHRPSTSLVVVDKMNRVVREVMTGSAKAPICQGLAKQIFVLLFGDEAEALNIEDGNQLCMDVYNKLFEVVADATGLVDEQDWRTLCREEGYCHPPRQKQKAMRRWTKIAWEKYQNTSKIAPEVFDDYLETVVTDMATKAEEKEEEKKDPGKFGPELPPLVPKELTPEAAAEMKAKMEAWEKEKKAKEAAAQENAEL